jgi:hypothetical protein
MSQSDEYKDDIVVSKSFVSMHCCFCLSALHIIPPFGWYTSQESQNSLNGLKDCAKLKLFAAGYKGKPLNGISETEAQDEFMFALNNPHTASQALQTSANYHPMEVSSMQESYGSVKAADFSFACSIKTLHSSKSIIS